MKRNLIVYLTIILSSVVLLISEIGCDPDDEPTIGNPVKARAGADKTVPVGEDCELNGNYSGNNNVTFTFHWSFLSYPSGSLASINNGTSQNATFTPDTAGVYKFKFKVTDSEGYSDSDTLLVNAVSGNLPVAIIKIEPDTPPDVGTVVVLDASDSYDPDGYELSYYWSLIDLTTCNEIDAVIESPSSEITNFTIENPGEYTVKLLIRNALQLYDEDEMLIITNPVEINSFTPTEGPVGTEVTIIGKNFSACDDGNDVFFRDEYGFENLATVLSATNNQIVTRVPSGSITGPITIENYYAGSCESLQNFIVTEALPEWTEVIPPVIGNYYGVDFYDENIGIIVGNGMYNVPIILTTSNGGVSWNDATYGENLVLHDVYMITDDLAIIVGDEGLILRTENGGENWERITNSPATQGLYAIDFPHPDTGYIVGYERIIRTWDGGENWEDCSDYLTGLTNLQGVSFVDSEIGTIVGYPNRAFRTTNGGNTWTSQSLGIGGSYWVNDVVFEDSLQGKIVGGFGILKTEDGGGEWEEVHLISTQLSSIYIGEDQLGFTVGDFGLILYSQDNGETWVEENSPTDEKLDDITQIASGKYIAVGNRTIIVKEF